MHFVLPVKGKKQFYHCAITNKLTILPAQRILKYDRKPEHNDHFYKKIKKKKTLVNGNNEAGGE